MRAPALTINRANVSIWIVGAVGLLLVGMLLAGSDLWYQSYYYTSTDNALVSGNFVHVPAPSASQVAGLDVQVGEQVERGQRIAVLQMANPGATAGASSRLSVNVRATSAGTVVSIPVREGQMVTSGQAVAVIADPTSLYVVANMDENVLKTVRLGQAAEVHITVLDRNMTGYVSEVTPEFAPGNAAAGSRSRANPMIPVRIELDGDREGLAPGMSAYVKIRIR